MENFASAAVRHWDNSTFLADNGRYQEAAYLAGYTVECTLKALVQKGGLDARAFSHDLARLNNEGLELALLLSPQLRRYPTASTSNLQGFKAWLPEYRYAKTSLQPKQTQIFKYILQDADLIAQQILIGLILDGLEELP